jgi:bile acid:Na+ symporter, BASS family
VGPITRRGGILLAGSGRCGLPDLGASTIGVITAVVLSSMAAVFVPGLGPPPARWAVAMTTTVRNLSLALFVGSSADPVVLMPSRWAFHQR